MATRIKSNQIADNSIVAADLHSAIAISTTQSGTFGSVIVDNITIDGSSLTTSGTNDFTVDSGGLIVLDADSNGDIRLANSAGQYASLYNSGDHLYVKSIINEGDVYLSGKDSSGNHINALRLDMGNGGRATFVENVIVGGTVSINGSSASPLAMHGAVAGDVYAQIVNEQAASTTNSTSIEFRGNTSTQERQVAKVLAKFTDITDASRDSRLDFYTFSSGTQVLPLTLNQLDAAFAGDVVITGDLTVEGSQVTLNTTALDVEDKNITLNYHASNDTSASADGAGITIQDAVDASTDASILWDATSDKFDFSHTVNISGSTGKLGIGTSNPSSTIDLTRTSDAGERAIRIENSSARVYVGVEGSSGNRFVGSAVDNAFIGTTTNDGLELATNNNVRMVIDTSGKVGIGDTSPAVILEANGQISSHVGAGTATYTTGILEINTSLTPTQVKITTPIKFEGTGSYTHAHTVTIKGFQYGSANTVDLKISWHVYLNQFYNRAATSSGGWAPIVTLGVENNYVVIHLSSPEYWPKIYVESHFTPYGGAALSTGWSWSDAAISNDAGKPEEVVPYKINFGNNFVMGSTGNVGIGYGSPSAKLEILTSNIAAGSNFDTKALRTRIPLISGYQGQIASAHAIYDSSIYAADIGYKYRNQGYDLTFSTNNNTSGNPTQHMVIDKSGNVGIGTDNPGTDLHVNSGSDTQIIVSADNSMALHQDSAWNSNLYFGAYHDGADAVYGKTGRGAFRMVNLHDGDTSPQYIAFYGADAGTKGDTITWNTVGLAMDEDGKVGIGTTNPLSPLSVHADGIGIRLDGTADTTRRIFFRSTSVNNPAEIYSDGTLKLWTEDANTKLSLEPNSGNVDIIKTRSGLISGGTGDQGATIRLHTEAQWESGYGNTPSNPDFLGTIDFSTGDSSTGEGVKASIRTSVESYYNTAHLNFYTADGSSSTTMVERMSLQQDGRIVINRGTTEYQPTTGVVKNYLTTHTDYNAIGTQHVSISHLDGNWLDGTSGGDSQYGIILGYNNAVRGGLIYDHRSTEKMTMWSSYAPIRFMVPDNADGNGVPLDSNINTALTLEKGGKVGVLTEDPKSTFHVDVPGNADGFAVGGKNVSLTTSFSTNAQLEITLGNHQACYVKVFLTGDWSGHSAMAFLGEYFVQNGSNAYAEAGQIIREVDNTHGQDYVSSQIYDGGNYDSFQIQFKLNAPSGGATTSSGMITYQVMGQFDAIT